MTIRVEAIPALESNYIWMIHNDAVAYLVDPGCANAAEQALKDHGVALIGILVTHHHQDHIGGVDQLIATHNVPVWGPIDERIQQVTHPVKDGDELILPTLEIGFRVIATPGHTSTHVAYANDSMIFAGDTLFSMGCGRLFEGTPAQMQRSLDRLAELNPHALVYAGHEYTQSNCAFAMAVEPSNAVTKDRCRVAAELRDHGQPTLPVILAEELASNPFLRTREPNVVMAAREHDPQCGTTASEVFATLRAWKDGAH